MGRLNGFLIEVGPVAQGLLNYQVYADTQTATRHALDYLELVNTGQTLDLPSQMEGYQFIKKVALPEDENGDITAMVHPDLQNRDYHAINPGDPLFITLGVKPCPMRETPPYMVHLLTKQPTTISILG